jgi:hypothetical protein
MQIGYHLSDREEWGALKAQLVLRFNTKDMGASTWILGMRITRNRRARTITLDQELYVTKALERYGMQECKPVSTPEMPGGDCMGGDDAEMSAPADLQLFQEMVGTLMYAVTGRHISHIPSLSFFLLSLLIFVLFIQASLCAPLFAAFACFLLLLSPRSASSLGAHSSSA